MPRSPAIEAVLTITPPPAARRCGTVCFAPRKHDLAFTVMTWSHISTGMSSTGLADAIPAMLTNTSRPPSSATAADVSRDDIVLAGRVGAAGTRSSPPASRISAASDSPRSVWMSPNTIDAPRSANSRIVAAPIPLAPPRNKTLLPSISRFALHLSGFTPARSHAESISLSGSNPHRMGVAIRKILRDRLWSCQHLEFDVQRYSDHERVES